MNSTQALLVRWNGSVRSCHAFIPEPWFSQMRSAVPISWTGSIPVLISWDDRSLFLGASTLRPCPTGNCIELSAVFAKSVHIPENVQVTVSSQQKYLSVPICPTLCVEPESADDCEIIYALAGQLEAQILNQVDVVQPGLTVPLWIHAQTVVRVRVLSNHGVSDSDCIRLGKNTAISVNFVKRVLAPPSSPRSVFSARLRVDHCTHDISQQCIGVPPEVMANLGLFTFVHVRFGKKEAMAQAVSWRNCPPGHVQMRACMRERLGLQRFDSVIISALESLPNQIDAADTQSIPALNVHASETCTTRGEVAIEVEQEIIVLDPDAIITDISGQSWCIRVEEPLILYGRGRLSFNITCVGEISIPNIEVDVTRPPQSCSAYPSELAASLSRLRTCLNGASQTLPAASPPIQPRLRYFGGLCFSGNSGVGKTHFLRALASHLQSDRNTLAACCWVDCAPIISDKIDDIKCAIRLEVSKAISKAPTLLVFDDLDRLMRASKDEEGNGLRSSQLAEFLADLLVNVRSCYPLLPIAWVASVRSYGDLHPSLRLPGVFSSEVVLPAPDSIRRGMIFRDILLSRPACTAQVDFESFGADTEGFIAQDIMIVAERVFHSAIARTPGSALTITSQYVENTLAAYVPLSHQKADLKSSETVWDDIGGLDEVRTTLIETFELPTRYSFLFEKSPLKLRSGLLLYGPPGCGKTLVASAVARECGMNFISVKGPELLNKYVGASEQAVRDLFSRAAVAAPCLLFFDECESIVPRRGADNTGVTDRVVNQMLCHLDGVENRSGVFILCATSRPDLMDPALLRPGRIDKCLYCGVPDEIARLGILKALLRKLTVDSDVDLASIAKRTVNFTGADIQGLLNSAHLLAVHEAINSRSESVTLSMEQLEEALRSSRVSVSTVERTRFQSIYAAFIGAKPSDFNLHLREGKVGFRTTVK